MNANRRDFLLRGLGSAAALTGALLAVGVVRAAPGTNEFASASIFAAKPCDGGKLTRFRFDDGAPMPRVYYDALKSVGEGDPCEIAIVMVHGWGNFTGTVYPAFQCALARRARQEGKPVPYLIAPQFPRRETLGWNGEPDDGRAVWNDDWKRLDLASRPAHDWRGGGDANGTTFASFDYIDRLFAVFADRRRYPNLKRVILAGFSAGGQFAGRYAATGKGVVRDGVAVDYIVMAPSTEFRLDPDQPWLYGLKNRPRYSKDLTEAEILKNLSSRRVWRGCGSLDVKSGEGSSLDQTPPAMTQGANRFERFRNFEEYLGRYPGWKRQVSFHVFEGIGHNEDLAYPDSALLGFVFR